MRKWLVFASIWTLAIMALCWLPIPTFSMGGGDEHSRSLPHLDKVIHTSIFAIFGLLWLRAIPGRKRYLLVALGGVALALITEVVQSLPLVGRDGEFADGLFDTVGVFLAYPVDYYFFRGRKEPEVLIGAAEGA